MSWIAVMSDRARKTRFVVLVFLAVIAGCALPQFDALDDFVPDEVSSPVDFALMEEYARYAQMAYRSEDEIRAAFPGTVRINEPAGTRTLYFLDASPETKTQTISVRGTKNRDDILHDIEFKLVPDDTVNISFHRGFEVEARLIYDDVKPFLNKDFRTRVTGHSLGAAVSAIMLIYLQRDGYPIEKSINFGQPKFTNSAGADRYADLPLLRVVDANDVVPMLPPLLARHPRFGSYAHVGEEVILLQGPEFIQLDAHDSARISVDDFWRARNFASKADHRMPLYLERIESKQNSARRISYTDWLRERAD